MALGVASVQVWMGQVRLYCSDHILVWSGIGHGLWPVHEFCAPLLGGGGGGGAEFIFNINSNVAYHDKIS